MLSSFPNKIITLFVTTTKERLGHGTISFVLFLPGSSFVVSGSSVVICLGIGLGKYMLYDTVCKRISHFLFVLVHVLDIQNRLVMQHTTVS